VVGDSEKYNAIATRIMKEQKIMINDLYGFCKPQLKQIQRPANVHFTPAGSKALGQQVVKHIEKAIQNRPGK
jgi:acyl-CoA thioesterase-1